MRENVVRPTTKSDLVSPKLIVSPLVHRTLCKLSRTETPRAQGPVDDLHEFDDLLFLITP
jgi:hypothetical protein